MTLRLAAVLVGLALGGCPREPGDPPRGDAGSCATHADCNGGRTCGELVACVDERCASARTVLSPCVDAAER